MGIVMIGELPGGRGYPYFEAYKVEEVAEILAIFVDRKSKKK